MLEFLFNWYCMLYLVLWFLVIDKKVWRLDILLNIKWFLFLIFFVIVVYFLLNFVCLSIFFIFLCIFFIFFLCLILLIWRLGNWNGLCFLSFLVCIVWICLMGFFLLWYLVKDNWIVIFRFNSCCKWIRSICISGFFGFFILLFMMDMSIFLNCLVFGFLKYVLSVGSVVIYRNLLIDWKIVLGL